jgi:hypothetical protein
MEGRQEAGEDRGGKQWWEELAGSVGEILIYYLYFSDLKLISFIFLNILIYYLYFSDLK